MSNVSVVLRRGERADVLLDDLLDLALELRGDVALGDFGQKGTLSGREVLTELSLPLGDLVDGDGVELRDGVSKRVQGAYTPPCCRAEKGMYEGVLTRPLTPA